MRRVRDAVRPTASAKLMVNRRVSRSSSPRQCPRSIREVEDGRFDSQPAPFRRESAPPRPGDASGGASRRGRPRGRGEARHGRDGHGVRRPGRPTPILLLLVGPDRQRVLNLIGIGTPYPLGDGVRRDAENVGQFFGRDVARNAEVAVPRCRDQGVAPFRGQPVFALPRSGGRVDPPDLEPVASLREESWNDETCFSSENRSLSHQS